MFIQFIGPSELLPSSLALISDDDSWAAIISMLQYYIYSNQNIRLMFKQLGSFSRLRTSINFLTDL